MKPGVVIHQTDEGGNRVEVPSIPGCAAQGDGIEELLPVRFLVPAMPVQDGLLRSRGTYTPDSGGF